ncbi:MAG: hypothetical protein KDC98_23175, partial [Planctomycetes bacterium]|nr:hypothetical protein [Planctomycetota bacterium]
MFLSLAIAGVAIACPGNPTAPAFHAFAAINDTLSHGQVGDNRLSLNEAIQLHNNTLLWNQLSAAEQAQLALIPGTGTSTFLSWARFDATVTPTITIERDLDVIVNTTYGLYLSSDNGATVFDFSGANVQHGMRSTSNSLQMRDLVFSGGPAGLDVVQSDIAGQIGLAADRCHFENQTQFGVRVATTTANGFGKMYLEGCVFDGATTGVVFDEAVAGRTSFFDLHDCRMSGVTDGVVITVGNGGLGRYFIDRTVIEASATGIELTRPANADRAALFQIRHLDIRATDCALLPGSATTPTTISMQMAHLWAQISGTALQLGQTGADVGGVVEDSTLDGAVVVHTGGGTTPLA